MAAESSKGTDAQLASDLADKSLEHPTEISKAADDLASGNVDEEGDEDDDEGGEDEQTTGVSGTGSTAAKKKKKKPRKKKKKATADDEPPELIPATTAAASKPKVAPVQDLQALLNQLALSQSPKKEGKAPEDYKFWKTQPVPQFQAPNLLQTTTSSNGESLPEGAILPDKVCRASAKPEPGALLDGFEWCLVDLENDSEIQELYDLLDNHYVEDADASFRFRYSKQFLSWALKPPGWKKEWHIGVRTTSQEDKKGKLVAFIAGIPVTMKVGDSKFNATEINFLAIHRKLRGKRLAPELIKEVTRRCYLNGIYQALYTAGTLLPTPVSTCRYFHRSLDWEHLYKTGFSHLPPGSTELKQKYRYKVESHTALKGLRPMKKEDVPAVKALLTRYLDRFHLRQDWTDEEIEHWLCSEASKGVVWTSVVEIDSKITDFVSYYLLEVSSIPHPLTLTPHPDHLVHRPPLQQPPRHHPRRLPLLLRQRIRLRLHLRKANAQTTPRIPRRAPPTPYARRPHPREKGRLPRLQCPHAARQPALPARGEVRARRWEAALLLVQLAHEAVGGWG